MKILKIGASTIVVLGLLGAIAWAFLTARQDVPESTDYVIDLDALQTLGHAIPGDLPSAVHHELVAIAGMPRAAIFAGESFEPHEMSHGSYQVRYPDGSTVLIDAAFSREAMEAMPGEGRYDDRAFEKLGAAIEEAETIVLTHEHFDHLAGLGGPFDAEMLSDRVVLNPEQLASDEAESLLPQALREKLHPLEYQGAHPVAPGVVLLRAPGHTPGSQIIYVELASGAELLLIGDVAWHMDQIRNLHYRPRLVTDLLLGENRDQVLQQFRALSNTLAVGRAEVIAAHDLEQRRQLIEAGIIQDGFP